MEAKLTDQDQPTPPGGRDAPSPLARLIRFFLERKLVVGLMTLLLVGWGVSVAPFDWEIDWLPRDPVPVDAIPNLGENQQIVFTEWEGRSPQDIEDQVTYPLTVNLMGVPGVKEVRSQSMLGFSMVFIIFDEDIEFYWSRARIIEKLDSLPAGTLPSGVSPALGPDATALGQIFWYSLEGRDPDGNPAGGWDLHELRRVQDWYVRYGLLAAEGISEVASIGGFVPEYHVEVDPDAMRAHDVNLRQVLDAVRKSNLDVGAGVTEINRVEYIIRGVGFIKSLEDIELATVAVRDGDVPILVRDVATVSRGPGPRRGAITVGGAEAVGGVTVVRENFNPLQAIHNVKQQIAEISPGLPARAVIDWGRTDRRAVERFAEGEGFEAFAAADPNHEAWVLWLRENPREDWPEWVTLSRLEIVPFYDRTDLIYRTLSTLNDALVQQILVTIVVVVLLVLHLRSAMVISLMLPLAVLMSFIMMKLIGIDANVVSLAGIAIAIGTIVDMGVIITENVLKHLKEAPPEQRRIDAVFEGTREVGSAVLTAICTTIISFLPVFTMTGAEGKMFIPLAYTKTFVLIGAIFAALTIVPAAVHVFVAGNIEPGRMRRSLLFGLTVSAVVLSGLGLAWGWVWVVLAGFVLLGVVLYHLLEDELPEWARRISPRWGDTAAGFGRGLRRATPWVASVVAAVLVGWILARVWEPLGPELGVVNNFLFVALLIGGILGLFSLIMWFYVPVLRWCLAHKVAFMSLPVLLVVFGVTIWIGFDRTFGFVPAAADRAGLPGDFLRDSVPWTAASNEFPGLGREFMPDMDEGSFLWMPIISYHGSIGEALEALRFQDMAITGVPEVEGVYGKLGRVESPLDPAPVGMFESVINYKSEYVTDEAGRRVNFAFDRRQGWFVDEDGELLERDEDYPELAADTAALVPDRRGRPYRQWREEIQSPRDIWDEIVDVAHRPGITRASLLQPIETRLLMLQTGMRAPMGLKVRAPDLETLERMALRLEELLREVPAIDSGTVTADRVVGKPYLEIHPDRRAISRYGLNIEDVQQVIAAAIGGAIVTETVEGRERFPVRVRYPRELRQGIEEMERIMVPARDGAQIPLGQIAGIRYQRGPQMIRSEDTFLTAFVTFSPRVDGSPAEPADGAMAGHDHGSGAATGGMADVEVVEQARDYLDGKVASGELAVPDGVSWRFAGDYEHQVRAAQTLRVVIPVAMILIFLILYFQFASVATTCIVFSGIAVAWAGGFALLYLYGQPWFANFHVFGHNLRALFGMGTINLSVAVWVGFLALFGIAVDNGVVMATYLKQSFSERRTSSIEDIRAAGVFAGHRRVRPCLMTTATTVLALVPILTATGTGADIMIPMAIPSVGGMFFVLLTLFSVPVLYCWVEELKWKHRKG